jgi:SAM-dependent methyltransferase
MDGDDRQRYHRVVFPEGRAVVTSRKKGDNIERPAVRADHYGAAYGNFASGLYAEIRAEAFGEDIGQQSWLSAEEQDRFIAWLDLRPEHRLLDVACGSGEPTLRIAERTGCRVQGIDLEAAAIRAAQALVRKRGLTNRAAFAVADASRPLDFAPQSFDAIVCIDAISHFPDRQAVLTEWSRLLKPGGSAVYTDPLVVTGPLSSREIAIRSSHGFVLFMPCSSNESAIAAAGLSLVRAEDRTENLARFAARRLAAREAHREALEKIEGKNEVDSQRELFIVAATAAAERRLSRFLFHARKPG